MKKIQILGTGCSKCKKLYELTEKTVRENNLDCDIVKVTDITEILNFGVMMTPALAVNGVVQFSGKIPKPDELRDIITNAQ